MKKLSYYLPHFTTEHLFLDKNSEVIYVIPFQDNQPFLTIPMDITRYIVSHAIVKSFCIFGVAFCYGCDHWDEWNPEMTDLIKVIDAAIEDWKRERFDD